MDLAEKISGAELEVMRILWREARPMTFRELREVLCESRRWEKSTVNTLLRRLTEKGVISADRRTVAYYTPNVAEEDYVRAEEQSMLDKLYGGSAKSFVAALCERGRLTEEDVDELKRYFSMGVEGDDARS